jgi:hypothetical protein
MQGMERMAKEAQTRTINANRIVSQIVSNKTSRMILKISIILYPEQVGGHNTTPIVLIKMIMSNKIVQFST